MITRGMIYQYVKFRVNHIIRYSFSILVDPSRGVILALFYRSKFGFLGLCIRRSRANSVAGDSCLCGSGSSIRGFVCGSGTSRSIIHGCDSCYLLRIRGYCSSVGDSANRIVIQC